MKAIEPQNVKSIGLYGHGSVGKTSLLETILYNTKAISRIGTIDAGNTTCDYFDDEIKAQYTIRLKPTLVEAGDKRLHIIDNPGFLDFSGEIAASSRVINGMIIVVDAVSGLQLGAEKAYEYAKKYNIPTAIFINKLDKEHTDFFQVLSSIKEAWGNKVAPVALPVGKDTSFSKVVSLLDPSGTNEVPEFEDYRSQLMESVAESDDNLLEKFLETMELSETEFKTGLLKGLASGSIIPVLCGSVDKNLGVKEFTSFIASTMPSLADLPPVKAGDTEVKPDPNGNFSAMVFKSLVDPFVGQLTFFKVFSGKLTSNSKFYNISRSKEERFSQLFCFQGKKQIPIDEAGPGDIVAVAKLKYTSVNDSLGSKGDKLSFPIVEFPEPMVRLAVSAATGKDEDKMGDSLRKIADEDPTFSVMFDKTTKESVIIGMGDSHLNLMLQRLKDKYQVSVVTRLPKVAFKETIKKPIKIQHKYKKQSGGKGQYGEVYLDVRPLQRGKGFEFVNNIVGGSIPKGYIPAVEKGLLESFDKGILAGYPVVDLQVILYDGSYHEVDSSEMAFKMAASMAIKKAIQGTKSCLLEPIMKLPICPE